MKISQTLAMRESHVFLLKKRTIFYQNTKNTKYDPHTWDLMKFSIENIQNKNKSSLDKFTVLEVWLQIEINMATDE
jgi:hypothetical protein